MFFGPRNQEDDFWAKSLKLQFTTTTPRIPVQELGLKVIFPILRQKNPSKSPSVTVLEPMVLDLNNQISIF
jgi:hypothetical protein